MMGITGSAKGFLRAFTRPFYVFRKQKVLVAKVEESKPSEYSPLTLVKPIDNPIITPNLENGWEAWQVFNPGVVALDDKIHFLYRAIGEDGMSRLGYAVSEDGFKIDERLGYPVYEHCNEGWVGNEYSYFSFASGGSWGGCEDPRIVRVGDEDRLYVTYTACDNGLRVAITSISVKDFQERNWNWSLPRLISKQGEVNKNWVIFPEKINGKYAILHSISPQILVEYVDSLEFDHKDCIESHYDGGKRKDCTKCWDSWVRGAGPPPIKTKDGWLLLYHAMDQSDPGKYKLGAMLLDLNDPSKILVRSQEPVLEPNEHYENHGFKSGVVYAVGAAIKDENLLVYYGGADNYVCVAYTNLNDFLEGLKSHAPVKLKDNKHIKKDNK